MLETDPSSPGRPIEAMTQESRHDYHLFVAHAMHFVQGAQLGVHLMGTYVTKPFVISCILRMAVYTPSAYAIFKTQLRAFQSGEW